MLNSIITSLINFNKNREYRAAVRTTIKELSKLSNYELNDIGIARGDIYHIAHSSYKKPEQVTLSDISEMTNIETNANLKGFV
jgi:uncharacterized protein YjiS (DUF1127 family)